MPWTGARQPEGSMPKRQWPSASALVPDHRHRSSFHILQCDRCFAISGALTVIYKAFAPVYFGTLLILGASRLAQDVRVKIGKSRPPKLLRTSAVHKDSDISLIGKGNAQEHLQGAIPFQYSSHTCLFLTAVLAFPLVHPFFRDAQTVIFLLTIRLLI